MEDVEVGVLIGLNCSSALRPQDVIHRNDNEPYAVKSLLGWHINGPVQQSISYGYRVTEFSSIRRVSPVPLKDM